MAYYEYLHIKGCWFKTGIIPTLDTRVEIDNAGYNSNWVGGTYSDAFPGLLGSNDTDWGNMAFVIRSTAYVQGWSVKVGNKSYETRNNFSIGSRYNLSIDKDYFTVGETQYTLGATSFSLSNSDIWVGTLNLNGVDFRCGDIYAGNVRIYQGGVLVLEWKPTQHNGEYTFYDTVSQTYAAKYGSGTIEPGPSTTVFEPSQYDFDFGFSGGTQTFTVEATYAWTCAAPTDFTINPMSGNPGTTTVTITAPSRISTVNDTVTFTDTQSNTFDISISQSVGTITPNLTLYQGSDTVKKMYYGSGLVYRKMAHSPSLVISGDSFTFPPTSYTAATVVVTTDANWSYSTEASWLSLTKTGNNLEIVPTSDWDQGSAPRTATVTVTADNGFVTKSAEIIVKQKNTNAENVDWVWVENQGMSTGTYIDTGIIPTTETSLRVVFQPLQRIGSALVGYSFAGDTQARTPMYSVDDDSDYRVFFYNSTSTMYFDFNSSRISKNVTNSGGFVDLTCTNNSITDNLSGQTTTGTTQSSMATTGVPIYLNLSNYSKVQSLEIWQGNTKVYDGHAAWDGENYGWNESISGTFSTQTYGGYALTGPSI